MYMVWDCMDGNFLGEAEGDVYDTPAKAKKSIECLVNQSWYELEGDEKFIIFKVYKEFSVEYVPASATLVEEVLKK